MFPTKFARDTNGSSVSLVHWKWGSRRTQPVGPTATRSASALDGHSVFVETTTPCHIRLGASDVTASEADPIIKPGVVYAFPRASGETFLSTVTQSGAAAGTLEYWEADTFVEA